MSLVPSQLSKYGRNFFDSRLSTLDSRLSTLDSRLSTLDSRLSTPGLLDIIDYEHSLRYLGWSTDDDDRPEDHRSVYLEETGHADVPARAAGAAGARAQSSVCQYG